MASEASARSGGTPSSLGGLLRTWRERALLTQEELARRTGLGVRTVRRLESEGLRRPRTESMRLLADALRLTDAERAQLIAAARDRPSGGPPARPDVPRQLPADVAGFVGRARQLREMDALLAGDRQATVVISAIAGTAGVGKTALAVHWAHRVADRFPDGQLYVNLRGFDPDIPPVEPVAVVHAFLTALDVPPRRIPAGLDAQAALYRSLLAGRRMLVVLDNAHDPEQVRPLLPGTPGCVAVVTSRNQLTGLVATEAARPLVVEVLSAAEARELLAQRVGVARVTAEPAAVDEIIARSARLPLALAIVAARAAARPALPLARLAAEVGDSRRRLDSFQTGDAASDLRAVFSWSYHRLSPPAARLFRLLSAHPGPDVSAPAAASLAAIGTEQVRPLLAELSRAHLVTEHVPGRFTFHDLLRAFAVELAGTEDGEAQRRAGLGRVLDHYLHTAYPAARLLHPLRQRFRPDPAQPGVAPEELADEEQALRWLTAEHAVLVAAIERAAAAGFDRHTYQLAWCLIDYLDWRGHWRDWARTQELALLAARRLGDRTGQVIAHRGLAGACARRGDYESARTHLLQALDTFAAGDNPGDRAQVLVNLSTVTARQGRHDEALRHTLRALDLYRDAGDRVGEGDALGMVGWTYALLGEHRRAVSYCRRSLAVHGELGNREGEAATLDSLGYAYHHLGEYASAVSCYERAIELCRTLNNRYYESFSLVHLGDTHCAAGDDRAANDAWQAALDILDDLGHPEADQVRGKLKELAG